MYNIIVKSKFNPTKFLVAISVVFFAVFFSFQGKISAGTPALVQRASGNAIPAKNINITLPGATTAGNLLIVAVGEAYVGENFIVTDNAGNTWTLANSASYSGGQMSAVFYAENIVANSNPQITVTAQNNSSNYFVATAVEYSGLAASNSLDTTITNVENGTTSYNSGSLITNSATELLFGAHQFYCSGATVTPTSPFSTVAVINSPITLQTQSFITSSAGTYSSQGTDTCGSSFNHSVLAAFKVSSSGTGSSPTISSFTASPTSITSGQSSTLSWSISGATSASISSVGSVAVSGSTTVSPTVTTSYTLTATNSNGSVSTNVTVTVSSGGGSPPIISNVASSGVTSSGATLTWTTDISSDSQVDYGTTNAYGSNSALDSGLTTTHSVSLSGLSASTLYHFRVRSSSSGGLAVSSDNTFTTSASGGGGGTVAWAQMSPTSIWPAVNSYTYIYYDPVINKTILYGKAQGHTGIYSGIIYLYDSSTNTFAQGPGNSNDGGCPADTLTMPGDRHPMQQQALDTKRHRLWIWGGVNSTCGSTFAVTASGSSISTGAGVFFSSWVGQSVSVGGAACTVATFTDSSHITVSGCSVPQGSTNITLTSPANQSPHQDTYYLDLAGPPAWHQVAPTHFPSSLAGSGSMAYIPDNDVLFTWERGGSANTHSAWVYCPTDAGTLSSVQIQAGCIAPDDWSEVDAIGTNGVHCNADYNACPPVEYPSIVYAPVTHEVVMFGGADFTGVSTNQTWHYNVATHTWTKKFPAISPPPVGTGSQPPMAPLAYLPTGKIIYHQGDNAGAPKDWQYDPAAVTWTALTSSGGGPTFGASGTEGTWSVAMAYDSSANKLITWSEGGYTNIWQGSLGAGGGGGGGGDTTPPSTPANLSATTISSYQINLSWTASTDNVAVIGYKIYRGGTQIGTSATNSYSDSGLSASTAYTYTVSAYDAASNNSAQSSSASATTLPISSGSTIVPLTIQEAIYPGSVAGVTRTQDPLSMGIPLADGTGITSISQLGLSGTSMGQFRVLSRWPSGNIKWVQMDTEADISAGGQNNSVALTTGSGNFGGSNLATDNGATITVNTGPAQFTIKKANFNVIDKVVVNGKTIVAPGTSQGLILTGPNPTAAFPGNVTCSPDAGGSACTTTYSSANDPTSSCSIEENGPVKSVIRCIGTHFDTANHPYMQFTVREYFYKNRPSLKVTSILRNANWDTSATPSPDNSGHTFNSAFKGLQAYELRIGPNISGTLNYTIATDGAPQTGTLSGTDNAYIYQGQTNVMLGNEGGCGSSCLAAYTTDMGYVAKKNGVTLASGDQTKIIGGWADIKDSTGAGMEIGADQMSGNFPESLEFNNGGGDVRIGMFSGKNSKAFYQVWPQWSIHDVYLNFHDVALASPANDFLKFQHYLVARPSSVSYINNTNVFDVPIPDAAAEDAYYVNLSATSNPSVSVSSFCASGSTANCTPDRGIGASAYNFPLEVQRAFPWNQGGPPTQEEFRWSDMLRFLQRGQTGRFLNSAQFYRYQSSMVWPHADGTSSTDSTVNGFTWRSRTPWCTPTGVGENCQGNSNAELSGYGRPWIACDSNYSVVTNSAKSLAIASCPDIQHFHWSGQPDFYFLTGDETLREAMEPLKDWYENPGTAQATVNGYLQIARDVGEEMFNAGRFGTYLSSIGQTADANAVLDIGVNAFNRRVKTIPCVNGYPAGCTPRPVDLQAGDDPPGSFGVDRQRGEYIGGRGTAWCPYADSAEATIQGVHRIAQPYQISILIEGLIELMHAKGQSWSDYKLAKDLVYGMSQFDLIEGYNYDGSSSWEGTDGTGGLYNGFKYMVKPDFANVCPTGTPVGIGGGDYTYQVGSHVFDGYSLASPGQGIWWGFYGSWMTNGTTADWENKLKYAITQIAYHQAGWPSDFGGYALNTLIATISNSSQPVLQDIPFMVVDQGSGNYKLSWTVPANTQSYRIKWSPKIIAPSAGLLNFDNLYTNTFGLSPDSYSTWFAANNITEPSPSSSGSAQNITISTGVTGLTAPNFSVKGYVSGAGISGSPIISSFTASPGNITSGQSSTLLFSVSGATSLSIDNGVGNVTGQTSKVVSPSVTTTYTLTATNNSGSVTSVVTVTVNSSDTTAPTISSVASSGVTQTSATISWTTNESSDSQVEYGTSGAYGLSTALNTTLLTAHSVSLSSLSPSTLYHYRVKSKDATGNLATSQDFTFTTSAPVIVDTTPPSAIGNLSSSLLTQSSALLSWTSPGNDGNVGTAYSYDMRYSAYPINISNFSGATQASGLPLPLVAGTNQTYTLVGLSPSTLYYVAIKTSDASNNVSNISNVISFTTLPSTSGGGGTGGGTGGTGSGGGGGGSGTPTTPTITNFTVTPLDSQISLSWTNPTDSSFVRTLIVRKEGSSPVSSSDGTKIYEGTATSFIDTNLSNLKTYYYRAFPVLISGIYEQSVTMVSASPKAGATQISTSVKSASTVSPLLLSKLTPLTTILARGIQNSKQITSLQTVLFLKSYITQDSITGTYTLITESAVKKYQCDQKIVCSGNAFSTGYGNVGPTTRKFLNIEITKYLAGSTSSGQAGTITKRLERKSEGPEVTILQNFLIKKGFLLPGNATGYFGPLTESALKQYQCNQNIICSGTPNTTGYGAVGPMTRGRVNGG
jgi:hypothetical protein